MRKIEGVYSPVRIGRSPPDGGGMFSVLGKVRLHPPEGTGPIRKRSSSVVPICMRCTLYRNQCSGLKWTWLKQAKTGDLNTKEGVYVSASANSEPPPGAPCLEDQIFKL